MLLRTDSIPRTDVESDLSVMWMDAVLKVSDAPVISRYVQFYFVLFSMTFVFDDDGEKTWLSEWKYF